MKRNIFNKVKISAAGAFSCLLLLTSSLLTSCEDWLDVQGENTQKEIDMFDEYKGFRDALTGCYLSFSSQNLYGMKLTMTDIENLACLWYVDNSITDEQAFGALSRHKYDTDAARGSIKSIYKELFSTIVAVNVLLKNIDENGDIVGKENIRNINVIKGEALAMRAYCQFDFLRLFGQLPKGGTKTVKLPYSYTTSIDEFPTFYDFNAYVECLKKDLAQAEELLKANDPIMTSTFSALNSPSKSVIDTYLYYRQARLNYWAVRALHARMSLYVGDTSDANSIAKDIINAKTESGQPVISLSGANDLVKGYYGLPNECLFFLSKYDLMSYATNALIGGTQGSTPLARAGAYYISTQQLNDLYASVSGGLGSHNRYNYLWNMNNYSPSNVKFPAIKKYWYDEEKASDYDLVTKHQIVPMLRLSEIYLIAMETSNTLDEFQRLYDEYMLSCSYTLYKPFETLKEAKDELINEYRRELFAEGQMFFYYKRTGATKMMWSKTAVNEDDYILPMPSSEYDPSLKN